MRILLTLFLSLILAGGATIYFHPDWIRIEQFHVELTEGSKQDLLFQRIKSSLDPQLKVFEGRFFWELPLKNVMEIVSRDKRVKKVSIFREFPNVLRLEIEPHTPVLAYLARDGRIYPVARDATLLPALAAHDAPDLPILRGEDLKDEPRLRELALDLWSTIPDDGPLGRKAISEILYSRKEGFKLYVAGSAPEIKLGDQDFGPKVSRVQKVMSYLESQSIKGRVIDARFTKKVVVRVRNTP